MDKKEGRRKTQQFLLLAFLSVSRAAIFQERGRDAASGKGGEKMPPPWTEEGLAFTSQPALGTREPSGSMELSQHPGLEACGHYFP